ncbi:TPA: choline ABC transporter substrate-binding protein [Burkholderia aenigmatica]|uniref:choline ABC transporter substrate-binding protein n=1 Tax=Burkholderia sp. AU45251 TaxID=3059204 RepID=UPI00264B4A51|nr:choline ABC transporter substrate-binding protein [Burkholderia sp. AU45251]HDR9487070.1 choline ABC transporter substrate-binding protein [Burkholderia aenigmatica]MDN7520031.1 choline ABC transporter substrate-binding protein [Burkholderia sp. AU45251]HDR9518953.1 choline ABC transporter substrate-binding protein [Burkholderia aenigmatica]HDR9595820.1 choline ABC transporter substrate-binding protein [Burkholderia aenigmatica]HDR9603810.1 choline ABC transporter substrate-binding protein 
MNVRNTLGCIALASVCTGQAAAQEAATCRAVRFADIGWTDIAATTALASTVLSSLGYQPTKTMASIPIALAGLKARQIDVYLGDWRPSMDATSAPFVKSGAVKVLDRPNLVGAKYTLAVPAYAYDAGLRSFDDIAKFADRLQYRIYGIEPGNDGNELIHKAIAGNQFGLGKFKLVESSEAGMLVEVRRAIRDHAWVVFLGWEPHPMNLDFNMRYLAGGDSLFGPNYGEAKVYTMTSPDYAARCPNVARLVANLQFTTEMENQVMKAIAGGKQPEVAAKAWLQQHPDVLKGWLAGVRTVDGRDPQAAVQAALNLH